METRTCDRCGAERSVAAVWYLVDAKLGLFVCGPCYEADADEAEHEAEAVP